MLLSCKLKVFYKYSATFFQFFAPTYNSLVWPNWLKKDWIQNSNKRQQTSVPSSKFFPSTFPFLHVLSSICVVFSLLYSFSFSSDSLNKTWHIAIVSESTCENQKIVWQNCKERILFIPEVCVHFKYSICYFECTNKILHLLQFGSFW